MLFNALIFCARYARWTLVAGLAAGLIFQNVAFLAKPFIAYFIALLLFAACFRIGHKNVLSAASGFSKHVWVTLLMQVLLPLIFILIVSLAGLDNAYTTALVLVAAAAPISGSPNLVIMLGFEPAPALKQLVIGTALLPVTVLPVFYFLPAMGGALAVAEASLRLLLVIGVAAAAGFYLRSRWAGELSQRQTQAVDGASAILMAAVVVGLMSALGDAWRVDRASLFWMMLFVFVLNFGLQVVGYSFWHKVAGNDYRVPMSVISGNRNIALYLAALPAAVIDDLFLFIGCYQFPMYLTPLLMQAFYRRSAG